ncbi:MAG: AmmeMemoRadiSam system protein B [Spirochaetes bacterium]|nr:AmmeMemoRadiSam system protein B [Spirochaetota bacterium]
MKGNGMRNGTDGGSYTLRHPVVSGLFYPDDKTELQSAVDSYLEEVDTNALYEIIGRQTSIENPQSLTPIVLVAPHAGFIFSGRVQASSYALLKNRTVDTAVIMGPSHLDRFDGVALALDDAFSTPLGISRVDKEFSLRLAEICTVTSENEKAHLSEHVVEVQLPFLQRLFPSVRIVSLLFGGHDLETVTSLYEALCETMDTVKRRYIVIASSDLSHYHPRTDAVVLDDAVIRGIEKMDPESLYADITAGRAEACGSGAILTGILLARKKGLGKSAILRRMDSGEVSGDRKRVVGYVSAAMY